MEPQRLDAGDQLHCPHCGRWHPLIEKPVEGTSTAAGMLYFECRGLTYFGGFVGAGSRHEMRKRLPKSDATCGQCREGWICEEHPDQPFPHDDYAGTGMPCQNPECPYSIKRTGLV